MIEMTTNDKKSNRTSPVWGHNARKWREMEKAVGEGGVVLGQEPMLAPIVKLAIFNGKM